jgi:circadian clock protein KaiC
MKASDQHPEHLVKRETGIPGLDTVTRGGLPAAGATLVMGSPGAGKTVMCLQLLAAALQRGEAGIFVSFEESTDQIRRDAASFNWADVLSGTERLAFVDARPPADADASGAFDLEGLTAALGHQAEQLGAAWIVLDGIDRLLRLQPNPHVAVDQVARLSEWCERRGIGLLLTGKIPDAGHAQPAYLEGLEFMLSTVLVLSAELVGRRLNRRFRIAKYRGTAHTTDELALLMDDDGLHLPYEDAPGGSPASASTKRAGTGTERLDRLLAGGVYRGSTTLISGQPGTSKTTLAVSFALAAARRGERVLYLSFDELADRIVRNVASVGMDLAPHIESGNLWITARDAWRWLIEEHYIEIQRMLDRHQPELLVIDPVSALLKVSNAETAYTTTERILATTRARGITTVMTSLTENDEPAAESTLSHTSTLADTWLTLDYNVYAGERNRALSIVKSRGTAHSNQVRELLLSEAGIQLADVYEYGTDFLMGTARLRKENEEQARSRHQQIERDNRRRELQREIEMARMRVRQAENEASHLEEALDNERASESEDDSAARTHTEEVRNRRDPVRSPSRPRGESDEATSERGKS